jgi:hypothetical protein
MIKYLNNYLLSNSFSFSYLIFFTCKFYNNNIYGISFICNYSGTLFLTNDEECRRVVDILL